MNSRSTPYQYAAPITSRARIERISEPGALNRTFAIAVGLILAMVLGAWVASGEFERLILLAVWFAAVMIIVFVRDYWWAPLLVITAFSFQTTVFNFPLTGMEIGVVVLAITFPVKIAMKSLGKAEPELDHGRFYWAVLGFVAIHALVIIFINKIEGVQLKNIIKSYYTVLTPLVFYGLLIRYCKTRTVRPTVYVLYFTTLFTVAVSIVTLLMGITVEPFTDLRIGVGWLDVDGAMGILRVSGPYLFIGSIAYWPAVRGGLGKLTLCLGVVIGILGTLVSGGRLSLALCIVTGIFFATIRGKLWLAIPFAILTVLTSTLVTAMPEVYFKLPYVVQRSLAPLNFSVQGAQVNEGLTGSDEWHRDLRHRSLDYWTQDPLSFFLGHGFKSWDTSIGVSDDLGQVEIEHRLQLAIEMGRTENMFSSITNIFGLAGMVLYGGFLWKLGWTLVKGRRLSPVGSGARALCEFSLVNLIATFVFSPFMGYIPTLNLICWALGVLAARPYLGAREPVRIEAAPLPSYIPRSLRGGR